MRPIPKNMLIHTCSVSAVTGEDAWGNRTISEAVTLTNIRIDTAKSVVITKDNRQLQLTAVLFYDCRNSLPLDHVFEIENVVSFGGREYTVKSVEPLYDGSKLHHYEVGLM